MTALKLSQSDFKAVIKPRVERLKGVPLLATLGDEDVEDVALGMKARGITLGGWLRSTPRFATNLWEIVKTNAFSLILHENRSISMKHNESL